MKTYKDIIGKVYLYLFSMLGLVLVVIGTTGLINLGLKNFVFNSEDPWINQPLNIPYIEKIDVLKTCENLTEQEKETLIIWLQEYETWEKNSNRNYQKYQNTENASRNLALLLVGIPLFMFHWRLINKKE